MIYLYHNKMTLESINWPSEFMSVNRVTATRWNIQQKLNPQKHYSYISLTYVVVGFNFVIVKASDIVCRASGRA